MGFGASRNRGRQVINAAATPEFIGYSPFEEVMSRTIEGAVSHSGTGQVSHLVENARARAGVKISVEEANERYGISKEEAARDGLLPEGLHFSSKDGEIFEAEAESKTIDSKSVCTEGVCESCTQKRITGSSVRLQT